MSRRKGELSRAAIDRDWPHQVALTGEYVVAHFREIKAAENELKAAPRGHSVFHEGQHYNVYCFADPDSAERFCRRFDGIPFDPKDHGKGRHWMKWNRP